MPDYKVGQFNVMKKYFLILFIYSAVYSQSNSVIVTYKISNDEPLMTKSEKSQNPSVVSLFEEVEKILPNIEFQLHICNNKSKFYQVEALAINNNTDKIARTLVDDTEYYFDFNLKSFECLRRFQNEEFRVKFIPIDNWQITNESKYIDGFLCYKATTKRVEKTKYSDRSFDVIAWFTPEIPIQAGPKQFYNLPGLILELKDARITYLAVSIKLNEDLKCKSELISTKELLSIEEYKNKIEKRVDNYKATIKN
ncbi:GLPGLI family protein [Flavobacterium sp. UBA6135]|uniref:GLPGLI family protein n=1 Tax=Flavobacterium sp. UBA6135 TaxID=1946553 RepID=UPI0025C376EC|nr:GLPGLI family protein [Flavobacterium sp. UBA6135]